MIPVIPVRRLAAEKRYEDRLRFEFEPEEGLLDLPYVRFRGPVKADLDYKIGEDGTVCVGGELTFTLEGACSRCLAPAEQTFRGEADGVFVEGKGDGESYGYEGGKVYLGEFLRDTLLFALPHLLLCGECAQSN